MDSHDLAEEKIDLSFLHCLWKIVEIAVGIVLEYIRPYLHSLKRKNVRNDRLGAEK